MRRNRLQALRVDATALCDRAVQTLAPFGWVDDAVELWPTMTRAERRVVLDAVRAEEAASAAYNRADRVVERACRREGLTPR